MSITDLVAVLAAVAENQFNFLALILAIVVLFGGWLAWRASRNAENKFSFDEMFVDPAGKSSMGRFGQFIALATTTWGFVYQTLHNGLSETYFIGYCSVWAGAAVASKFSEKGK